MSVWKYPLDLAGHPVTEIAVEFDKIGFPIPLEHDLFLELDFELWDGETRLPSTIFGFDNKEPRLSIEASSNIYRGIKLLEPTLVNKPLLAKVKFVGDYIKPEYFEQYLNPLSDPEFNSLYIKHGLTVEDITADSTSTKSLTSNAEEVRATKVKVTSIESKSNKIVTGAKLSEAIALLEDMTPEEITAWTDGKQHAIWTHKDNDIDSFFVQYNALEKAWQCGMYSEGKVLEADSPENLYTIGEDLKVDLPNILRILTKKAGVTKGNLPFFTEDGTTLTVSERLLVEVVDLIGNSLEGLDQLKMGGKLPTDPTQLINGRSMTTDGTAGASYHDFISNGIKGRIEVFEGKLSIYYFDHVNGNPNTKLEALAVNLSTGKVTIRPVVESLGITTINKLESTVIDSMNEHTDTKEVESKERDTEIIADIDDKYEEFEETRNTMQADIDTRVSKQTGFKDGESEIEGKPYIKDATHIHNPEDMYLTSEGKWKYRFDEVILPVED